VAPLEERMVTEQFGTTAKLAGNVFKNVDRFKGKKDDGVNLGPGTYDADKEPGYIVKGPLQSHFGSLVDRQPLFARDVSRSPFKDPTNLDNPSPVHY
jgi:hypothetical protein